MNSSRCRYGVPILALLCAVMFAALLGMTSEIVNPKTASIVVLSAFLLIIEALIAIRLRSKAV